MISMSRWLCVPKPMPGRDPVLVDDAQRAEAHVLGIVIVGERKAMEALQPAVIGVAALITAAKSHHRSELYATHCVADV